MLHSYRTHLLSSDTWLIHSSPVQTKRRETKACIIECSVDEPVAAHRHRRCTQRLCGSSSVLVIQSSKPYPPSFQFQPARRELRRFNRRRRSCAKRKDMPAPKLNLVFLGILGSGTQTTEEHSHRLLILILISSADGHGWNRWTEREQHTHTHTRGANNNKKKKLQTTTPSQALVSALQLQLQACSRRPPARRPAADQLGPQQTRW